MQAAASDRTSTWPLRFPAGEPHVFGIEWNAENQLKRVPKNAVEQARFSYDPLDRRVERVAGGATSLWAYDAEDILRENAGSTAMRYVHGPRTDEPLAQENGAGALSHIHADGLGSVVRTSNASGAVIGLRRYDAFGNIEVGATDGYAFTGREWDVAAELAYYRARYYDPAPGRFLSEDPIGYEGGMNLFAYVGNRPVTSVDPFGEQPLPPGQDVKKRGPKPVPDTIWCKLFGCSGQESESDRKNRQVWGDALCREYAFGTRCAYAISTAEPPPSKSPPTYVGGFPVEGPDRLKELEEFERRFNAACAASAPQGKQRVGTCKRVTGQFVCVCCEKCTQ